MYNLRFPLISLHDYDNAFNEHILVFACSSYLGKSSIDHLWLIFEFMGICFFRGYLLLLRRRCFFHQKTIEDKCLSSIVSMIL